MNQKNNKKINVAIFCAYFYPHKGGVEQYVQKLFSNLKNINVTILTSNTENSRKYEKKFGMKIYRFESWNLMNETYPVIKFSEYKNIKKIFEKQKFDYIITHTRFFNSSLIGLNISKKFKIPLIHFEHGTDYSPIKNPLLKLLGVLYDHTIGRCIIKNSIKLVGVSKASEKFIRHLYKKSQTTHIYNSIDTSKFKKIDINKQNQIKSDLKIKNNEKIIIYVGRIIFAKGVQDLFEATKDITNLRIVIIGDGNYLASLKEKYPLGIYLGSKDLNEIIEYLSIADIFVNPSYAEGLPTSVLEAGAIGVPVIATDVGGTREIIQNGKNGYLIEPKNIIELKNKIKKILSNNETKKFSKNLSINIKKIFDIEVNKTKIISLLNHR